MVDGVVMVTCDRRNVRLTSSGCARMYLSAKAERPAQWEARAACVGCASGAARAGQPINGAEVAALAWRACCSRCRAGGRRLISGDLCISCWNRNREARIGRDRKGHRPRLADALHTTTIVVTEGEAARLVTEHGVLTAAEVMVRAAKKATRPLLFGWPAAAHRS